MVGAAGRVDSASLTDVEDQPGLPRAAAGGARATERAGLLAGGAAAAQASYSAVAAGPSLAAASAAQEKAAGCASSWPRPVRAVACCCCWSTAGLAKLLTDPGTQQIAVAFVVGDQFGKLIYSLVNNLVAPLLFSLLFETRELSLKAYSGFVVLTNPNNAPVLSVESAGAAGCRVLAWSAFLEEGFVFLATMLTLYWVTKALRPIVSINKSQSGAQPTPLQAQPQQQYTQIETATCEFCIRPIHPLARRCPHCTSAVAPSPDVVQALTKALA